MKNIWKVSLFAAALLLFSACSSDTKTNTETFPNSWEIRELESSNEWGGNSDTDLQNDSFR